MLQTGLRGIVMKKKVVSKGKPRSLRAKGLSPKRSASVKGGGTKRDASAPSHSEFTVSKLVDSPTPKLYEG
jgi:hypothetical protein